MSMRFFKYALVIFFIACVIAEEDDEDEDRREDGNSNTTPTGTPNEATSTPAARPAETSTAGRNSGDEAHGDGAANGHSNSGLTNTPSEVSSTRVPTPSGSPTSGRNSDAQGKPGGQGLSFLLPKGKGIDQKRLRPRCFLRPEEGNCAGSHLLKRWWYDQNSETCKQVNFPVCDRKMRLFFSCKMCLQRCVRSKSGKDKTRWIQKVCGTKL
uniref:Anticoagulant protein rhipilin 1 n=1 Tax=Rhipicephalus zambeziensis TaxID=60191 RepID=A0A224Y1H2_9ACAR